MPDRAQPGRFVERHWLPRHTPVLDAAGQMQFIIQSVWNITASRLAERRLRESRAREQVARAEAKIQRQHLSQVLMQLPFPLLLLRGPTHAVALINPQCQRLFPPPHSGLAAARGPAGARRAGLF